MNSFKLLAIAILCLMAGCVNSEQSAVDRGVPELYHSWRYDFDGTAPKKIAFEPDLYSDDLLVIPADVDFRNERAKYSYVDEGYAYGVISEKMRRGEVINTYVPYNCVGTILFFAKKYRFTVIVTTPISEAVFLADSSKVRHIYASKALQKGVAEDTISSMEETVAETIYYGN